MTGERYAGFENLSSYRNYPFSETADTHDSNGIELASDIVVDAFLYPVLGKPSRLLLTLVDFRGGGYVEITVESTGDLLVGDGADGLVELYDYSGRHAGTLSCGPGWQRELSSGRRREFNGVEFSPSVTAVITHSGVMSLSSMDGYTRTTRKNVVLEGDGCIVPVLEDVGSWYELSFDAQDDGSSVPGLYVRRILVAAAGRTIFDVQRQSEDTVLVTSPKLDREDVCWQAHKEDAVSVVSDTCDDSNDIQCPGEYVPFKLEEVWMCPSRIGDLNLVAEDVVGLKNSLHIVPVEGSISANVPQMAPDMGVDEAITEAGKLLTRPTQVGNGIRISIPGLGNGI